MSARNPNNSISNAYILAPGVNGSELLRSMAKLGQGTIGTRIVGGEELARIVLMRSGHTIREKYLSSDEEVAILYSVLRDEKGYFENVNSYSDAVKISAAIRTVRGSLNAENHSEEIRQMRAKLCGDDAKFPDKNKALVELYVKYVDKCEEWGAIDSIGIIRRALSLAEEMEDADFSVLNEYPITNIEEALIWKLSLGKYRRQDMLQLIGGGKRPVRISEYIRAYGVSNEVENIIERIYSDEEIRPDRCTIACADPRTYSQHFFDASCRYGIPMTFGMGLPITNSFPGEFLELLACWAGNGRYGVVAFEKLLKSSAFSDEEFYKTVGIEDPRKLTGRNNKKAALARLAGQLKISFDDAVNRERIAAYKPVLEKETKKAEASVEKRKKREVEEKNLAMEWLEKMLEDLASGPIAFFNKYAVCREYDEFVREFDKSAKATIMNKMIAFGEVDEEGSPLTIAPEILGQSVYRQSSKPGHIHITGISGAGSVIRDKLFVCGLSADNFPGNPRENYLILDADHELLRPSDDRGIVRDDSSKGVVERNKITLRHLIAAASSLEEDVFLSYSDFDTAELKERNPSSVLYEYYREGNEKATYDDYKGCFNRVGFFDAALSESREIAKKFVNNEEVEADPDRKDIYRDYSKDDLMGRPWSPSALDTFFRCPRSFYLQYVRGISNESEDDMFSLMEGPATGNLAHDLLEDLAGAGIANVTRDEFSEWAREAIEGYFLGRIPINKKDAEIEANRFVELMRTAYDRELEQKRTVLEAEKVIEHKHPCGIKLKGYPDRVEETSAGECVVADFKTKRRIEHESDDIDTCLQAVIYAWLYEQEYGRTVSWCEYKYLRQDRIITCRFDDEMKKALAEKLDVFKTALEDHIFDRTPGKDNENCRYCQFGDICNSDNWPNTETGEESDDE